MTAGDELIRKTIQECIAAGLPTMPSHIREWAEAHLVEPRVVTLSLDPEGKTQASFWLVTDHTGVRDSANRVVYDANCDIFGLEFTTATGVEWYHGAYGSFAETVIGM